MSGGPPRVFLDANPDEEILPVAERGEPALGSDPFASSGASDPLLERVETLSELLARAEASLLPPRPAPERKVRAAAERPAENEARRRWATTPRLAEVELLERARGLEALLPESERRRLAALDHLADGDVPYDRFGFSPSAARTAFPLFLALYRFYFRVSSSGHEHLAPEGPAILAANHAGLLPFDGAMTVVDVLRHTDPPRLARAVVDRWAGELPFVNVFLARVGQVVGTRENFADLLDDGQLVLVFPEGMAGARKTITERYRLQRFHTGFVEQALRTRAPIVPVAIIGSDDQTPILFDIRPLARWLGLPAAPITPTFPWLGPLGLLPYPVRYRIVYGEPLRFHERFGPDAAHDARLVQHLTQQVRRSVQTLLDRNR